MAIALAAALGGIVALWLALVDSNKARALAERRRRHYKAAATGYEAVAAMWEDRYRELSNGLSASHRTTGEADPHADTAPSLEAIR